ncbi:nucleoside diphosphate kinase [Trichinella spiralis]|uniref:nucleoside diphosphate kinase n=1 Tax=Trichinella spiralis TaxID=6334 RepID=UPI0001EFEB05|nr:nucleoside diphosphate kinase [Trichinella spiralis]
MTADRTMSTPERTFLAVKPDGVQRGLVNEVLRRFEQRGYKLIGLKMLIFYCCLINIFVGCDYPSSCSFKTSSNARNERTLVVVKPDGVQRGLIHQVLRRFEQRGFKLFRRRANDDLLNKHYAEHVGKGFFPSLKAYMSSGPVVAMVWEGRDVVKAARNMLGATRPLESAPGTLRGDFCIDVGRLFEQLLCLPCFCRNLVHGSDSIESAKREIALWFKPEELCKWEQSTHSWIYES